MLLQALLSEIAAALRHAAAAGRGGKVLLRIADG